MLLSFFNNEKNFSIVFFLCGYICHSWLLDIFKIKNEGLKLIVSLNSNKIKKGNVLTINATLLNINNTKNITFAACYGEIKISIFDKYDNIVYGEIIMAPGPTVPFPIFKLGEKISHLLKWDTSKNILNGSIPPSIGKYYLEIEAYVTNQETKSRIILKIERIEVELF